MLGIEHLCYDRYIDPNTAISASAVFPQSGRISPEKRPIFRYFSIFSQREHTRNYQPHIDIKYV